jgi:phosphoglycerate dehydrogenase-like enzyme
MHVVVLDDFHQVYEASPHLARLRERATVTIHTDAATDHDTLVARLRGAQALIANRERSRLTAELFDALPELELIAQTGTGLAHIDVPAATARGIVISTTPGGSTDAVVEATFALVFAVLRHLSYFDRTLHAGQWPQRVGRNLSGRTFGVVGLGRIGDRVARIAAAFGARVLAWSPHGTPERAAAVGAEYCADLDALLRQSDVVSIHVRLSPQSRGLIDRRRLALMPDGAVLINTARGPIVDEAALVDELNAGRLWAGLDVYDHEPLPTDHPLRRAEQAVLLPHVGWVTEETYDLFIGGSVDNILAYLDGRPANVANPDALARPRGSRAAR